MAIFISGSLAHDYILNFPDVFQRHILPEKIEALNVCFMVDKAERSWGGTAGNIAYAIKLLGGEPLPASLLGKDGHAYLKYLKKQGISTAYIKIDDRFLTASAYITTDQKNNQISAFFGGPLGNQQRLDWGQIARRTRLALISPTQKQAMIQHLTACFQAGMETVFDPGQQITAFSPQELQEMLVLSHFVIGNDYEIKLLQKKTGWGKKVMLQWVKAMITTLGAQGSLIETANGPRMKVKPATVEKVADPTGAGDAFRAGFFVGYEKGHSLETCAQIGSIAASFAIESYGTQKYHFTKQDFGKRYKETYGQSVKL